MEGAQLIFHEITNTLGAQLVLILLGIIGSRYQLFNGSFIKQINLIVFKVLLPMRIIDQFWSLKIYQNGFILIKVIPLVVLSVLQSLLFVYIVSLLDFLIPKSTIDNFKVTLMLVFQAESLFSSSDFYSDYLCNVRKDYPDVLRLFNVTCDDNTLIPVLYIHFWNSFVSLLCMGLFFNYEFEKSAKVEKDTTKPLIEDNGEIPMDELQAKIEMGEVSDDGKNKNELKSQSDQTKRDQDIKAFESEICTKQEYQEAIEMLKNDGKVDTMGKFSNILYALVFIVLVNVTPYVHTLTNDPSLFFMMANDVFHSIGRLTIPAIGILVGYIFSNTILEENNSFGLLGAIAISKLKVQFLPFMKYLQSDYFNILGLEQGVINHYIFLSAWPTSSLIVVFAVIYKTKFKELACQVVIQTLFAIFTATVIALVVFNQFIRNLEQIQTKLQQFFAKNIMEKSNF